MKQFIFIIFCFLTLSNTTLLAQEPEKQKTPVEIAAEQAEKYKKDLNLTEKQFFLVDSTLQTNFSALSREFEKMKAGGRQTISGYDNVRDFWQTKTEESFNKILTPEQFIKYMKLIGKYDRKGRPIKKK